MQKNWQEELKSLLNCDLKELYPLARSLKRKLYFFVGPTNSGKTYTAMEILSKADCGAYLAPLRLLALEGYETLNEKGINTSLVTGEEQLINDDASHFCSTIEMVDFNLELDVAIIDEVQMLEDIDRGWAWVNAILGTPAREIYMTGSVNALEAIKKIALYLGEELEVRKFKRKNPLKINAKPTELNNLRPATALIAFSRSDVLKLKEKLSKRYNVSVIYGNLSPEVRREEAKKFRDGSTQILIATDAVAMGLNLPIETILFTTDTKFDGVSKRKITPNEVIQIVGRAGRYKIYDIGFIGATRRNILAHIHEMMEAPIKTIKPPFKVKATMEQIEQLSSLLNTKDINEILRYFTLNMKFSGPFSATNISSMQQIAKLIEQKNLTLEEKYLLVNAPIYLKSKIVAQAFDMYVNSIIKKKVVNYRPSITLKKKDITDKDLLLAEDEVKKISLYLWLSYKLPNLFPDMNEALKCRQIFNTFIEKSLNIFNIKKEYEQKRTFKKDYKTKIYHKKKNNNKL